MLDNEVKDKSIVEKWCEDKHEQIINDLSEFFVKYKNANTMNVYPIISKILTSKDKISKLKEREFNNAEDLEFCFDMFKDIMATINLNVIYVPDQQDFCTFMGWTDRIYKKMLKDSPNDIREVMEVINEYVLSADMKAGQQGILKQNLTKFKMQLAGDHGQNLVTQKEQMEEDRSKHKLKTKEELQKMLNEQGFRAIDSSKKS